MNREILDAIEEQTDLRYATLNALVEVLAATICEASPNWDFAEIMTDAAVNRLYDLVDDGTRKKVIRRGE